MLGMWIFLSPILIIRMSRVPIIDWEAPVTGIGRARGRGMLQLAGIGRGVVVRPARPQLGVNLNVVRGPILPRGRARPVCPAPQGYTHRLARFGRGVGRAIRFDLLEPVVGVQDARVRAVQPELVVVPAVVDAVVDVQDARELVVVPDVVDPPEIQPTPVVPAPVVLNKYINGMWINPGQPRCYFPVGVPTIRINGAPAVWLGGEWCLEGDDTLVQCYVPPEVYVPDTRDPDTRDGDNISSDSDSSNDSDRDSVASWVYEVASQDDVDEVAVDQFVDNNNNLEMAGAVGPVLANPVKVLEKVNIDWSDVGLPFTLFKFIGI